jgi:hypothetical protein
MGKRFKLARKAIASGTVKMSYLRVPLTPNLQTSRRALMTMAMTKMELRTKLMW